MLRLDAPRALPILMLAMAAIATPAAGAPTLKVHGAIRFDAHAARRHGRLVVEGRTLDDAGAAVARVGLRVGVARSGSPVPSPETTTCSPSPTPANPVSDEAGRFCFELALPLGAYEVSLEAPGTALLAEARQTFAVDLAKRAARLRFDPEPGVVLLDGFSGTVEVLAELDEDEPAAGAGLELELSTEAGPTLARATTSAGGRATFAVAPESLGPPGRGALIVRFAGDAATMAAERAQPIERRAVVVLTPPASARGAPEDGIPLAVMAHTRFGATPTGTVEALVGGATVGAASVVGGRADLVAVFAPEGAAHASVVVRYVPDEPFYVAGAPANVRVEVRAPSSLRQAPLVLGALAAFAWVLAGRAARKRRTMTPAREVRADTAGTPRMELVAPSARGVRGWSGRVVDAHEGVPLAGARVAIERPGMVGAETLASAFTDGDGLFALDAAGSTAGATLTAEGPLHAGLTRPLPVPGRVEIALVSRKRKLLDRLVAWARRRGPPFDARPEPTPGDVGRAAGEGRPEKRWADAVERAAFDDAEVDARREKEVRDLEPPAR